MAYSRFILTVVVGCMLCSNVKAQDNGPDSISKSSNAIEFYKIKSAYENLQYESFHVLYSLKKSDSLNVIRDTSSVNFLMHNGMMKGYSDSTELLMNSRYFLMISHEDSMINVTRAKAGEQTFQLNILDSLFQQANIQGLEKTSVNDSTYALRIYFRPNSYYKNYQVTYGSNFLIKKIVLEYPDTDYDDLGNPPPEGRRNIMEITYSNYLSQPFDISIFNEGNYVRKNEYGEFVGVGPYQQYQIIASEPGL